MWNYKRSGSWYEDAIHEITYVCPTNNQSISNDLIIMQNNITPLFDVPLPHHPEYTYGRMFLIEDSNLSPAFEWVLNDLKLPHYYIQPTLIELQDRYFNYIMKAKDHFNKPRPKVKSKELNILFPIHDMPSAQAPALPSGHAIQALLFGCLVIRNTKNVPVEKLHNVARWCLEVGMRRVVGGVHYPADVKGAIIFVKHATGSWRNERVNMLVNLYYYYDSRDMTKWWLK